MAPLESLTVPTASGEGLAKNPAMYRWLMGFPKTWDHYSPHWGSWDLVQEILYQQLGNPPQTAMEG